ncbi:MAG: hypothetical protein ACI4Q4_09920 [Oscillospiraceae bacterium]
MPQLKNWFIVMYEEDGEKIFRLKGNVYGHSKPSCSDGVFVRTSRVLSVEDCGETLTAHTRKTPYTLRKEDMSRLASPLSTKAFAESFSLGSRLVETAERKQAEFMENAKLLKPRMLYLEMNSQRIHCFEGAIFCGEDGSIFRDELREHCGMFEDTAYLAKSDVSWGAGGNYVSFYYPTFSPRSSEDSLSCLIRNSGEQELHISIAYGREITIRSGELARIPPDDSPDSEPRE